MRLNLPEYVSDSLNRLIINGFEAWCVGGAVRDHLMSKTPFDYDITTNATPSEVISIFDKTIPTGIKHGTVTVVTDSGNIEVTTYRADGNYSDYRTPDNVEFKNNIDDDLKRRDFTMNAICYNHKRGLYDPLNGLNDIKNKTIRAIGDPYKRFTEDALRIIRAFRFSSQLGFNIENSTKDAAVELFPLLQNISVERIYTDLVRIVLSSHPNNSDPLFSKGAFEFLGIQKSPIPSELNKLPFVLTLRFAYLFKKIESDAERILRNLKADNHTINETLLYSELLDHKLPDNKTEVKYILKDYGLERLDLWLKYHESFAHNTSTVRSELNSVLNNKEPYTLKDLSINGNDLISLIEDKKSIGRVLNCLLDHVIQNPTDNTKAKLIKIAHNIK